MLIYSVFTVLVCGKPPPLANGQPIEVSMDAVNGTTIQYNCSSGFSLKEENIASIVCLSTLRGMIWMVPNDLQCLPGK